jgi:hypothetical protein
MKRSIKHLTIEMALILATFANQSLAQSTPQQVAGTVNGKSWQALTDNAPAVAVSSTTKYVAWKSYTNEKIMFSAFNGTEWTSPQVVSGSNPSWTAESNFPPALAVDFTTGNLWLAWTNPSSHKIYTSTFNGTAWTAREVVSGSGWTAQTGRTPALGFANHNIYVAWTGYSTGQVWFTYWNYPGWATQNSVSGLDWIATSYSAPGWAQNYSGLLPTLFWTESSGDIVLSIEFPGGWISPLTVSCNGWVAQTAIVFPPAPAYLTVNGNTFATLFWLQNGLEYSYNNSSECGWAQPATVTGAAPFFAPAVSVGPTMSILAWNQETSPHTLISTIWYLDPTTLPGVNGN